MFIFHKQFIFVFVSVSQKAFYFTCTIYPGQRLAELLHVLQSILHSPNLANDNAKLHSAISATRPDHGVHARGFDTICLSLSLIVQLHLTIKSINQSINSSMFLFDLLNQDRDLIVESHRVSLISLYTSL